MRHQTLRIVSVPLFVAVLALGFGACGGPSVPLEPLTIGAEESIIYIYRERRASGAAMLVTVDLDGSNDATVVLQNGSYTTYRTTGDDVIRVRTEALREEFYEIDVAPGQALYFRTRFAGFPTRAELIPATESEALGDMGGLTFTETTAFSATPN